MSSRLSDRCEKCARAYMNTRTLKERSDQQCCPSPGICALDPHAVPLKSPTGLPLTRLDYPTFTVRKSGGALEVHPPSLPCAADAPSSTAPTNSKLLNASICCEPPLLLLHVLLTHRCHYSYFYAVFPVVFTASRLFMRFPILVTSSLECRDWL